MTWLSSGEVLVGLAAISVWVVVFGFARRRSVGKQLGTLGFAVVPIFFLLWLVLSVVLTLHGLRLL